MSSAVVGWSVQYNLLGADGYTVAQVFYFLVDMLFHCSTIIGSGELKPLTTIVELSISPFNLSVLLCVFVVLLLGVYMVTIVISPR